MKKININVKYIWLFAAALAISACSNDDDASSDIEAPKPALVTGEANFSKYIAVGASFSGGFTDNALFVAAQTNSFPNMLSQKFALAGGGSFTQPLMADNIGGFVAGPTVVANPRLFFNGSGPAVLNATPTTQITDVLSGSFNNYGIPGLKSFHLGVPGYGFANPYFGRMASTPGATVLGDAAGETPTFFTLSEIGGNDVLTYATSGGTGVDQTGNVDPSTYGSSDITDPNVFAASFSAAVDALIGANDAKGVVTNVPYIASLAHFTTVPYNPVPLDSDTASQLNAGYATYNGGLQFAVSNNLLTADEAAARTIVFEESANNRMVIIDEDLTDLSGFGIPSYRQSTSSDLFVLPLSSLIPQGYGTQIPLEDKWVLIPSEQAAIKTATDAYNATIEAVAANKGLAVVDFKGILDEAATTGYSSGNFIYTTALVRGGLISLDGIHLTARGYAIVANEMMKAIDITYGSNFEASGNLMDVGTFPTNYPPTLR
mgnify:CR=1 FL=1|tara:strand:- start:39411 stop:40877 length:1467 start_codon:yes stop_codon:yes gene_type:complete